MPPISNNLRNAIVGGLAVLAGGLIISAIIGSYTFFSVRSFDQTFSVTGSAKQKVNADTIKWVIQLSRESQEGALSSGYASLDNDLKVLTAFLRGKGVPDSAMTISSPSVDERYYYEPSGYKGPRRFGVRQTVTIQSNEVAKITEVAKDTSELAAKGISFESRQPEYFYSELAKLRVELLGAAVIDAKARATEIAQSSGRKVGKLKNASSGVVQVLAPNSIDISDYGQYDTFSIEKEVMVTVRASFFAK